MLARYMGVMAGGVDGAVDRMKSVVAELEIDELNIVVLVYGPSLRTCFSSAEPRLEKLRFWRVRCSRGNVCDASAKARTQVKTLNALSIANSACSY